MKRTEKEKIILKIFHNVKQHQNSSHKTRKWIVQIKTVRVNLNWGNIKIN